LLLIFDWDGTLIDSKAKITQAMHCAIRELKWEPIADGLIHNVIGLGLPEAIFYLFPEVEELRRTELRDSYAEHFIRLDQEKSSSLFPWVQKTLGDLRSRGHLLAVATGKSRRGLDRILGDLGMSDYFDATRCADETASKPHPLMLRELLAHFNMKSAEAVMVGDTEYDMEMAMNIDMPRIAVSYGAHSIERLHKYKPELCLDSFDQLLRWQRLANS
jgi:phosphoglycolate phosphatase